MREDLDRRTFLRVVSATAGALGIGVFSATDVLKGATLAAPPISLSALIEVGRDGRVRIFAKNPEIGSGVKTSLPLLVAEELDVDWSAITVEQADLDAKYGSQFTGGSTAVWEHWQPLRQAGAAARMLLIAAAAKRWQVDPATCHTDRGSVVHAATRRSLAYGAVAADAATLQTPVEVRLKDPATFRLIGHRVPVVDAKQIVTGRATYGFDASVPGMLVACIAAGPVGATIASVDDVNALAVPGVVRVVRIAAGASPSAEREGIAVVAKSTWSAMQGRKALHVTWTAAAPDASSADLERRFAEALRARGTVIRNDGDVDSAFASAAHVFEATYEVPFLAHVPMEPIHYLADMRPDGADAWGSTQVPDNVAARVAAVSGLPLRAVTVHMTRGGGGFGRRLADDYAAEAAILSKAVGNPVKVVWTRADDIQHDFFRPAGHHRIRATLSADGRLVAWAQHLANTSRYAFARNGQPPERSELYPQDFPVGCVPNARLEYSAVSTSIRTGAWRSTLHSANAFAVECFIDELAHAAGKDPVRFRLEILGAPRELPYADHGGPTFDTGRLAAVIEDAAARSGWPHKSSASRAWGFAAHFTFGTYVAEVAEISVRNGAIKVHRVVASVDCGTVVNLSGAEAQIQGAVVDGLSSALFGEITVADGVVAQRSFDDYRLLRIDEAPHIDVHFLPGHADPRGLGEPGVPPVAPAVANAVFAATGHRLRRLPLQKQLTALSAG